MRRISPQERRDVSGARQLVETTILDRLEMAASNAQALLNFGQAETACFALIAQQPTDSAARCGLAFNRSPIDLIRHE